MKTLLVTGWGLADYACAAALALRQFKKGTAEVVGVSRRYLPVFLATVPAGREVLLLGVGLLPALRLDLLKGVRDLKARGVPVRWLSIRPPDPALGPELRDELPMTVLPDAPSLTAAVARDFHLPPNAADGFQPLIDADRAPDAPRAPAVADRLDLLAAALFAFRNYQDTGAYPAAIRHLAADDAPDQWPAADRLLLDHYRRYGGRELVGGSPTMRSLAREIGDAAPHDGARVLILGESGTGKETVAQQIHLLSPRRDEPFIAANCACLNKELVEDRFFGHEKGAFSGALDRKPGLFELANGGTLFLDEIGELPLDAQALLLRVLEEGRFMRLGGHEEVSVDVRVVAATNRDLAAMVRDGRFRQDLFYRLDVVEIRVPPLREHKEDLGPIADSYWLRRFRRHLEPEKIVVLQTYDWPGNVRELFNFLERASIFTEKDFGSLLATYRAKSAAVPAPTVPDDLDEAMRLHVRSVFEKCDGNLTKAADALGVSRVTARKYLKNV